MRIEMYDELKRKMVSINPDSVEVVMEKDTDDKIFVITKILSRWREEDDVIVYIGHSEEMAFETRLATELQIKQEEENAKMNELVTERSAA